MITPTGKLSWESECYEKMAVSYRALQRDGNWRRELLGLRVVPDEPRHFFSVWFCLGLAMLGQSCHYPLDRRLRLKRGHP